MIGSPGPSPFSTKWEDRRALHDPLNQCTFSPSINNTLNVEARSAEDIVERLATSKKTPREKFKKEIGSGTAWIRHLSRSDEMSNFRQPQDYDNPDKHCTFKPSINSAWNSQKLKARSAKENVERLAKPKVKSEKFKKELDYGQGTEWIRHLPNSDEMSIVQRPQDYDNPDNHCTFKPSINNTTNSQLKARSVEELAKPKTKREKFQKDVNSSEDMRARHQGAKGPTEQASTEKAISSSSISSTGRGPRGSTRKSGYGIGGKASLHLEDPVYNGLHSMLHNLDLKDQEKKLVEVRRGSTVEPEPIESTIVSNDHGSDDTTNETY
jgi:hypothetical protein